MVLQLQAAISERERRLQAEVETLREEVAQLREQMAPTLVIPASWRLKPGEETLFRHFLARDLVTRDSAMAALFGAGSDRDPKAIEVRIHYLRRKLKDRGGRIHNRWGLGWWLEDRLAWRAALERGDVAVLTLRPCP